MGVYIPPSEEDLGTIKQVDMALRFAKNENTIILGDPNVNYDNPKDERAEGIVEALKHMI